MKLSQPDAASQFPGGMNQSDDLTLSLTPRCCCGRDHCAYLDYNDAALRDLEDDLRRAAEAGQVGALSHCSRVVNIADCTLSLLPYLCP